MKKTKIILSVILILFILAIGAAVSYAVLLRGNFSQELVRTETMYTLLILFALLPIVLIVLLAFIIRNRVLLKARLKWQKTHPVQPIKEEEAKPDEGKVEEEKKEAKQEEGEEKETETETEGKERFCMLKELDRTRETFIREEYDEKITLKKFCDELRAFAAGELRLYYDIADIRRFVAGLGVTHIAILQGMSGTGKTSLAYAMGQFLDNSSTVISVQPMWKERTDLIGYYNEFTKQFNETMLLRKMYEANYSKDMYITVLDEMNIARVEYYFAEFLSLLEIIDPNERYLDVVSDKWDTDPENLVGGRIKFPENMWFVGTANNDDSTFAISDKVYDRAMIMNLDKKSQPFMVRRWRRVHLRAERFNELVKEAQTEYALTERNRRRIKELDEYLIEKFHITFGNRIMRQIMTYVPVYIACGGEETEALDDILSKKVLRKLEMQNPVYVRGEAQSLIEYLDKLFGEGKMPLCKEFIQRLQRNV